LVKFILPKATELQDAWTNRMVRCSAGIMSVFRAKRFMTSLLVIAAAAAALWVFRGQNEQDVTGVADAIDGDSLRIGTAEVRLIGLDAPELAQTCRVSGRETPCGREARAHLRRLVSSGLVTCIGAERDRYGRLLARCRVRGIDINAAMVRDGHAVAFGAYQTEEAEARAGYRGIWAGTFERPRDWRALHPRP
jgi:endonuclease YncB( thermonuclease family)